MKIPEWPEFKPVLKMSPALFESLRTCTLKGLLDSTSEYRKYRFSHPKALIGTVCHEIIQKANLGEYDGVSTNDLTARLKNDYRLKCSVLFQEAISRSNYVYRRVEDWPSYNMRFHRLLALVMKVVDGRRADSDVLKTGATCATVSEQELKSASGNLVGRPDRILAFENGDVVVEDYKSGEIYEDAELKPNIRRQMLLYAFLCQEALSAKQVIIRVVPLDGTVFEESVSLSESAELANEALQLQKSVNNRLLRVFQQLMELSDLAAPSNVNCKYCPYKFRCDKYWGTDWSATLDSEPYVDVHGLVDMVLSESNYTQIKLRSEPKLVIVSKLPMLESDSLQGYLRCLHLKKVDEDDNVVYTEFVEGSSVWSI